MKNQQSVFYIEIFISPYDGVIPQGIVSSLEKAVEFCKNKIQSGKGSHTDNPYQDGGLVINEYQIDNFNPKSFKSYNDKGVLLEV